MPEIFILKCTVIEVNLETLPREEFPGVLYSCLLHNSGNSEGQGALTMDSLTSRPCPTREGASKRATLVDR